MFFSVSVSVKGKVFFGPATEIQVSGKPLLVENRSADLFRRFVGISLANFGGWADLG